ncbi:hypothetical protein PYCC9005_005147 [Savitreella phatthalungensis]
MAAAVAIASPTLSPIAGAQPTSPSYFDDHHTARHHANARHRPRSRRDRNSNSHGHAGSGATSSASGWPALDPPNLMLGASRAPLSATVDRRHNRASQTDTPAASATLKSPRRRPPQSQRKLLGSNPQHLIYSPASPQLIAAQSPSIPCTPLVLDPSSDPFALAPTEAGVSGGINAGLGIGGPLSAFSVAAALHNSVAAAGRSGQAVSPRMVGAALASMRAQQQQQQQQHSNPGARRLYSSVAASGSSASVPPPTHDIPPAA